MEEINRIIIIKEYTFLTEKDFLEKSGRFQGPVQNSKDNTKLKSIWILLNNLYRHILKMSFK